MKLKEKNNWEHLNYMLDERLLTLDDKVIKICFKTRWSKFDIDWRIITRVVNDMGHEYTVSTEQPWITIKYRGFNIPVELMMFAECEMKCTD